MNTENQTPQENQTPTTFDVTITNIPTKIMTKVKDSAKAQIPITIDLSKIDESWLRFCLAYGVKQKVADMNSEAKGDEKVDAVRASIKELEKGGEMPERLSSGRVALNPTQSLAVKNAKASLVAMFRKATGGAKAIEFAQHERTAKYYVIKENRAIWKDDVVMAWMADQAAKGKKDYMKEAESLLVGDDELDI